MWYSEVLKDETCCLMVHTRKLQLIASAIEHFSQKGQRLFEGGVYLCNNTTINYDEEFTVRVARVFKLTKKLII